MITELKSDFPKANYHDKMLIIDTGHSGKHSDNICGRVHNTFRMHQFQE